MYLDSSKLFEVDIDFFEGKVNIPFDVYIKLSDGFIKIIDANQTILVKVWDKIKEKKVKNVFIQLTDQVTFIKVGLKKNLDLSTEDRISSIVQTTKQIFSRLENVGITHENTLFINSAAEEIVSLIQKKEALRILLPQLQSDSLLFSHSMLRTIFCLAAAKKLQWSSDLSLSRITLASLYCDISLKQNFSIVIKDPKSLSIIENEAFLNHMERTIAEFSQYVSISTEIKNSILHHHEYCDGSGPLGISKNQIYPIGHLIRIGDEITSKIIKSSVNPNPLSLEDCLSSLENSKKFNKQIVLGFNFLKKEVKF